MQNGTPTPDGDWLSSWRAALRRRWPVGAGVFVAILGLAAALLLLSRPTYRAESSLRLGSPPPSTGLASGVAGMFGLPFLSGDPFANDLELLASRTLAEGVVLDAALAATLDAPRGWHRDSIFERFEASRETDEATYALEWRADGPIDVRRLSPTDSAVGSYAAGRPVAFGGLDVIFRPWREGMPREVRVATLEFDEAVRRTRSSLQVERARREANVVLLGWNHTDPAVAREVVSSAVDRFIELRAAIQRRESGQTVDSLRSVARETARELEAAEAALEAQQRRTRLFSPEIQGEAFVKRYAESAAELERAKARLAVVDAVLQTAAEAPEPSEAWADLVSVPAFFENEMAANLLTRLTALEERRRELRGRRSAESREARSVAEQIAYLDGVLRSLAVNHREALAEGVARLESSVVRSDATLASLPSEVIELGRRQRDARILSEVMALTEARLRQEELRNALSFSNVQTIDPPALLPRPVWPRKKLGLAVAAVLAGMFGVLGMVVAERADGTVRQAARIQELIGAPVLGVARRGKGGQVSLHAADLASVLQRGRSTANGGAVSLVPVTSGEAAAQVGAAMANGHLPDPAAADVVVLEAVDSFATAAAASARPVTLVVVSGRTRETDLRRTAERIREAGGSVAGAVVVCDRPADAAAVWA